MAIRIPTTGVLDVTNTSVGVGSVAGGFAYPFLIPQDTDNVIVKFTPSVVTGHMGVIFQTSDDGGTTYYDVARTSTVSALTNANAQWLSIPTIGSGLRSGVVQSASVITAGIGGASASTLGSQQVSGLPILGVQNRVFLIMGGGVSVNDGTRIQVKVNQQSATA